MWPSHATPTGPPSARAGCPLVLPDAVRPPKGSSARGRSSCGGRGHASADSANGGSHELDDPGLGGRVQLGQGECGRPHGTIVEGRAVVEAERRVAALELLRVLEEADDLA